MRSLVEKIEQDAAEKLVLPEGTTPAQDLAPFKNFLRIESARIRALHDDGAPGILVCRARAGLIDALLRGMWNAVKLSFARELKGAFPPIAMVAVGGYGRGQLCPRSDIDFIFLHEDQVVEGSKPLPVMSRMTDGVLYPLWDLGMKVGYSVRTVEECITTANEDMQSKTALVEARLLEGDEALFLKLQKAVQKKCVSGHEDQYIQERLADQAARHAKNGNSPFMQEPNIKNGCGGLRDFQNLQWMAFFKYGTRSLKELKERELISDEEQKRLEKAYDYLLRVRNDLHYLTDRPVDVLSKSVQPKVAGNLGFNDRSPSERLEKFMRQYYFHARNIYFINRTLEQRLALLPRPRRMQFIRGLLPRRKPAHEPVDGFLFDETHVRAATPRVFRDQPRRLMRVFLQAQQRGLRLHPDLAQMIRNQLSLADREFLHDGHVHETFLTILGQRGNVSGILRQMHEVGLLAKYMPEFGALDCLVQHEFYHQYTADEHTLVCLEKLDRVWEAVEKPYSEYSKLFQDLERPQLLYLALLLHDCGKSDSHGDHAKQSSLMALQAAKRLGLDGSATHTLRLIIENHLAMIVLSQRRDLSDASIIRSFAHEVQTVEHLAMLTLHTVADSLATSDTLWNDFKESLLWTLHRKTMQVLTGTEESRLLDARQRDLLMEEIGRNLPGRLGSEELEVHFNSLPPRYFEIHSAEAILRDLALVHRFLHLQLDESRNALEPIVDWHNAQDRGYTVVKICTWDRAALFNQIAGSFSAAGLNILSAQIFTRADYIALDSFFVTDARTGGLANRDEREKFEALLLKTLSGDKVDFAPLVVKKSVLRPAYQSYDGETIPTRIQFISLPEDSRSAIEVETEDRVGLLYAISGAFAELGLNISAAKIVTEKGAAIDTFYVNELDGSPIVDPSRQSQIEAGLQKAIQSLDKK